ncbi:unnamed protein product, partial [Scytosiphon promiscuus]
MEEDLQAWRTLVLRRIETMQAVHQQQRLRLEAEIESNPNFHAGYSQNLTRLMQREEGILAQGGVTGSLTQRVEEILASETRKLFKKLRGARTEERWRALFRRQSQYRERLFQHIRQQARQSLRKTEEQPDGSSEEGRPVGGQQQPGQQGKKKQHYHRKQQASPEPQCFEEREAVMRAASAARWGEDEFFGLKNAFGLQLERLEADWAAHEEKVGAEYAARRALLQARAGLEIVSKERERLGTSSPERGQASRVAGGEVVAPPSASSGRWRSSEKQQSRLIHTAPIFQPEAGKDSPSGLAGGRNAVRGSQRLRIDGGDSSGAAWRRRGTSFGAREAERELERLDDAFSLLMNQVRAQKEAAHKWIRRQRIRMEAQIEGMEDERGQRLRWLSAAEKEEKRLIAAIL